MNLNNIYFKCYISTRLDGSNNTAHSLTVSTRKLNMNVPECSGVAVGPVRGNKWVKGPTVRSDSTDRDTSQRHRRPGKTLFLSSSSFMSPCVWVHFRCRVHSFSLLCFSKHVQTAADQSDEELLRRRVWRRLPRHYWTSTRHHQGDYCPACVSVHRAHRGRCGHESHRQPAYVSQRWGCQTLMSILMLLQEAQMTFDPHSPDRYMAAGGVAACADWPLTCMHQLCSPVSSY